jgi:Fe2+ transport system protein FeoA
MKMVTSLNYLVPGQTGVVSSVLGSRLMEMGLVRGTEITVIKTAPLGDPMEILVKGYHLSLRRDECLDIMVIIDG